MSFKEFEKKVIFKLVAESDTKGKIHITRAKNNDLIGTLNIEGESVEDMERLTRQCARDHYKAIKKVMRKRGY